MRKQGDSCPGMRRGASLRKLEKVRKESPRGQGKRRRFRQREPPAQKPEVAGCVQEALAVYAERVGAVPVSVGPAEFPGRGIQIL